LKDQLIVTGGAGFIGSNFVHHWIENETAGIVNLDRLTYAGNMLNLESLEGDARHIFVHGDIADGALIAELFRKYQPRGLVHFAAESHVDRSIYGPEEFVRTNVVGTCNLLDTAREYWSRLTCGNQQKFRFLHVSTDEVYGSLDPLDPPSTESAVYAPNSPYAASKAASDHFVRAYHHTYGLPVLLTNCSNNYGPRQFPEKLIPLMIINALDQKPLPVYGDGLNVRDWIFVEDHCAAIRIVLARGRVGQTYHIGGRSEKTNLDVVKAVCATLQEARPSACQCASLISFVKDRPGHDRRYALDTHKIEQELGWKLRESFETGIRKTVRWYLENTHWVKQVTSGAYQQWVEANYGKRG